MLEGFLSILPTFQLSRPYFKIFVTTPAPTVRPPSRIAKRSPSSIAIGVISSIVIFVLSPRITISPTLPHSPLPLTPAPPPHSHPPSPSTNPNPPSTPTPPHPPSSPCPARSAPSPPTPAP